MRGCYQQPFLQKSAPIRVKWVRFQIQKQTFKAYALMEISGQFGFPLFLGQYYILTAIGDFTAAETQTNVLFQ